MTRRPLEACQSSGELCELAAPAPATPQRRVRRRLLEKQPSEEKENRSGLANVPAHSRAEVGTPESPTKTQALRQQQPPGEYLVARERECAELDAFLGRCMEGGPGKGGCLYVSGGTGVGKTCSARAVAVARQRRRPETRIIEVNCMELPTRSPAGLFRRLEEAAGRCKTGCGGTAAAAAEALAQFGTEVVVIVDEVDQLAGGAGGARALEGLCSLPRLPGAPAVALVAIANTVGLLSRFANLAGLCESLLFKPYEVSQLRKITGALLAAKGAAPMLGSLAMEVRLREVARRSGDCRQVVGLCDSVVLEAAAQEASLAEGGAGATPPSHAPPAPLKCLQRSSEDPLRSVQHLPLEQQVLICALAGGEGEAMRLREIFARYKALFQRLHQPDNLASREQVGDALLALEQCGLLSLRASGQRAGRGALAGRALRPSGGDCVVELAVSRAAVLESIFQANPMLERCMK